VEVEKRASSRGPIRILHEDGDGSVCCHRRFATVGVSPTDTKVDIKQSGLGALWQGLNPEHVEIWRGPGPEKGVGVGERPPGAVNLGGWEPFGE